MTSDSSGPLSAQRPEDTIYKQTLLKPALSTISFPIYLPSYDLFKALETQSLFLCLVISLKNYFSLLKCYINSSSTHPFEFLTTEYST